LFLGCEIEVLIYFKKKKEFTGNYKKKTKKMIFGREQIVPWTLKPKQLFCTYCKQLRNDEILDLLFQKKKKNRLHNCLKIGFHLV